MNAAAKIFAVFSAAFMLGCVRSFKGIEAFGNFASDLCFFLCFTLIIFAFFGNRRKIKYETIPAAVIAGLLTYGSVNTFVSQMSGGVAAAEAFPACNDLRAVAPLSGLAITFIAGFGMLTLFFVFVSSLLSEKKYRAYEYLIMLAVFFVSAFALKLTFSHAAVSALCPDAVKYFADALAQNGIEQTPMNYYLHNLGFIRLDCGIQFGKNYIMSVQAVSYAAASVITLLTVFFAFKDKFTALLSLGGSISAAVSLSLACFIASLRTQTGFIGRVVIPHRFPVDDISLVHFMTGFFIGFLFMLILCCVSPKGEGRFRYEPAFSSPYVCIFFDTAFCFALPFGVSLGRPLGNALTVRLVKKGLISENVFVNSDDLVFMCTVCLVILVFFAAFAVIKKNIIIKGVPAPIAKRTEKFSLRALPALFAAYFAVYLTAGYGNFRTLLKIIKAPRELFSTGSSYEFCLAAICTAAILFFVNYAIAASVSSKKSKG